MSEDPREKKPFGEVHGRKRFRVKGRFAGLGKSVDDPDVKDVDRTPKKVDYRKYLERLEPSALHALARALRDKKTSIKDKIVIAQDVLDRLHGKRTESVEGAEIQKRLENMSLDELKAYIREQINEVDIPAEVIQTPPSPEGKVH